MSAHTYVHEAELVLAEGADPAAVGAMVTVALCGHWKHEGPCRWPHVNQMDGTRFRIMFVAIPEEESEVRDRIRTALLGQSSWRVVSDGAGTVAPDDKDAEEKLLRAPRR